MHYFIKLVKSLKILFALVLVVWLIPQYLSGRPFGGCSILYRRHLSLSVTPIYSCLNRFCAVKLTDSSGTSFH